MKGDTATIRCSDPTKLLIWRNGLRVHGSVNVTCDTCQMWNANDMPYCESNNSGKKFSKDNENITCINMFMKYCISYL